MNTFKPLAVVLGILFFLTVTGHAMGLAQVDTWETKKGTEVRLETLVSGLDHPWGMAFLPDDRLLVTERNSGNLYIVDTDHTLSQPLEGVPEVR
ncbi:MAG: PQQ-dependent sugar dehydrogenase, partial [Desulfovibrionales bacterium]